MKKIKFLIALAALMMMFSTCSENDPGVDPSEEPKPVPTPVGIPNGTPSSKTIGASGGTISSLDGMVALEIPEGALSADTEITIQPVTNFAPNGNGNAYRFGPEETKFNKPIMVTFPYSNIDNKTPPLTGIAFQDTDGIWYSTGKFTWDETNKTVSTETIHFSDWVKFNVFRLLCNDLKLAVEESTECILFVLNYYPLNPLFDDDDALLTPLTNGPVGDTDAFEWLANGLQAKTLGPYGQITPLDGGCTYTAPAKQPNASKNPVNLSVTLKDLLYKDERTGQVFKDLQLFTAIEITGDQEYTLTFAEDYSEFAPTSAHCVLDLDYRDTTVFDITVRENGIVVLDSIKNSTPAFTYKSVSNSGCTCLEMKFENGSAIEYTDFKATVTTTAFDDKSTLAFEVKYTFCRTTDRYECLGDPIKSIVGPELPGNRVSDYIDLPQDTVPIVSSWNGNGTLTVERKK